MSRKERSRQLFTASVITAVLAACALYFAVAITGFEKAKGDEPKALRPTRPQVCQEFYDDGTDQWKECMGVGYR